MAKDLVCPDCTAWFGVFRNEVVRRVGTIPPPRDAIVAHRAAPPPRGAIVIYHAPPKTRPVRPAAAARPR